MEYWSLKHLHVACVTLSLAGFLLRGAAVLAGLPVPGQRWVRVAPHVVDTLLLASAIGLCLRIGQYPFVDSWLSAKVLALTAYIALGSLALKPGRSRGLRAAAYIAALAVASYIVSVALTRTPLGFLNWMG